MSILILNILKGSLQSKLKGANVWPFNAQGKVARGWVYHTWPLYRYCKEKIDQTQLQWYIGQFLHAPAGPGRFLGLTLILLVPVGFVQFGGGNHVVNFYQNAKVTFAFYFAFHTCEISHYAVFYGPTVYGSPRTLPSHTKSHTGVFLTRRGLLSLMFQSQRNVSLRLLACDLPNDSK